MKVLSVIRYTFSIVGIALVLGAVTSYKNTIDFLKEAVPARNSVGAFQLQRFNER